MASGYIYTGNVVDIEASGMGRFSYPIEIAMVAYNGVSYESLILPEVSWDSWSDSAEKIHGISRDTLLIKGRSAKQVCEELNTLFAGETFYSDCWPLDSKWLSTLYEAARMTPSFNLCSTDYILNEHDIQCWAQSKIDCAEAQNITPHRALADARIIKHLLDTKTMQRQSSKPFNDASNDALVSPVMATPSASQESVNTRIA